ncbi:hypothetical protein TNCV_1093661 [Trichonephila clavipes]|uniref:Uncharacterized protein n=1 Tax=Trichonephila clavipes TaxID=2585209 RepID=A0A8X6RKW2_TRICX|nr:hypothetical protein TNCV_1093661 [Trichonephila clavipes]
MLDNGQTITITASCDMWIMTKSVISVTTIVECIHNHTPRNRIKEVLVVTVEENLYSDMDVVCVSRSGLLCSFALRQKLDQLLNNVIKASMVRKIKGNMGGNDI